MGSHGRVRVSRLFIYPLKSGRAIEVQRAQVDSFGLRLDRRWMVVDAGGGFLTQRELPRLALVVPRLDGERLCLSAPGMPELRLSRPEGDGLRKRRVRIRSEDVVATFLRGEAAAWITEFLGCETCLVHMPEDTFRPVDPLYATAHDRTAFTDGYPFLLASEDSLADLNRRLAVGLPIARFRPNIVVRGSEPYDEDAWRRFRIGEVGFRGVKRCGRCVVTTIDQETAEKGEEPLRTLSRYRTIDGKVCFGVNLIHEGGGEVRVGQEVEIGERGNLG